jgi:hypothetical protein
MEGPLAKSHMSGEEVEELKRIYKEVGEQTSRAGLALASREMDPPEFAEQTGWRIQSRPSPRKKGGAARAAAMTPERRAEIAKAAAAKRWLPE